MTLVSVTMCDTRMRPDTRARLAEIMTEAWLDCPHSGSRQRLYTQGVLTNNVNITLSKDFWDTLVYFL